MWKIMVAIVLVMGYVWAQPFQELLLPQARHVAGVVVDPDGKPVVEASIDHSNDYRHSYQTDSDGRFELDTRAPILVVRKAGFRSELVRTKEAAEVRVTLQRLSVTKSFPICSDTGRYYGIRGQAGSFQFLKTEGIKEGGQGHDIDYGSRSYFIETKQGRKAIMHGSGALWSFGIPLDPDVWRSAKYDEVTYYAGRVRIIDARGQFSDGTWWRTLGKFGETASYTDMDEVSAKILDGFLDNACLTPPQLP
jgi:hypothetical protein